MTDLTIREATITDLSALLDLSQTTFAEAFASQNKPENMQVYMSEAFNEEQLKSELLDDHSTFFLALTSNQLVGYAKLRKGKTLSALDGHRIIEIQRIYVLARMKGQKIGQKLMQICLDTAAKQGYELVWLGVWEQNPAAIAFYQHCGFEQFSSHIFHFGDEDQTDLLMRKSIS